MEPQPLADPDGGADRDPRRWFGSADRPWFERVDAASSEAARSASPARRAQLEEFRRMGVTVLRGAASPELCAAAVEALGPWFERTGAARLTNAGWALDPVRRLADLDEVTELVAFLYGRRPIAFQTLNFAVGTQQDLHRDEIHFDSLPPGFMCGAWVALEPVGPDQGPVSYAPGSSEGDGEALVDFTADVGDVLVWSASVLHGGSPIVRAGSSRWSQVTHYVFEDCVWYTPLRSDLDRGRVELRLPLVDVVTGRRAIPRLDGARARFVHGRRRQAALIAPGARVAWWRRRPWRAAVPVASVLAQARWARATGRPPTR